MCPGPDTGLDTWGVLSVFVERRKAVLSEPVPSTASLALVLHACTRTDTPVGGCDAVRTCVSGPGPVWVCILHMSLVCVDLHVCLSLCAWTWGPVRMSVLTPQVSGLLQTDAWGQVVNSLCVGGEGAPALLTSPFPRGSKLWAHLGELDDAKQRPGPGKPLESGPRGLAGAPPPPPRGPPPPLPEVEQPAPFRAL